MTPVLAADLGNWIGLAILVLSFLGWIVNAIKGVDANGNPLPQRQKPKPQRDLRSEIEVFLQELQPQKKPDPPPRMTTDRVTSTRNELGSERFESRFDEQRSFPPPLKQQSSPRPRNEKQRKAKTANSKGKNQPQPQTPLRDRARPGTAIGQSLSQHVSSYMASGRVASEVQQNLPHRIDQAVQQDLSGGTVAAIAPISSSSGTVHPLMALLTRPEGIQQAILLNEILQRPRSLQSTRSSHR